MYAFSNTDVVLTYKPEHILNSSLLLFQAVYHCEIPGCGAVLKTRWSITQHMKKHMGIYQYHCPYCNKGFYSTTRVKQHLQKQHTGLLGYHCVKCKQEFESIHLLKVHIEENKCQIKGDAI